MHSRFPAFESLTRALVGNIAGRVVQFGALLLSAIVLARALGPMGLGIVAIVSACLRLALVPVEEGVAKLCEREIAGAIGRADGAQALAALRFGLRALCLILPVVALAIWFFLPIAALPAGHMGIEKAAVALLLIGGLNAWLRGILRGEGQTVWAIATTNAQSLCAPLLYLAWLAGTGGLTPATALWLHAGSKLILLPLLVLLTVRAWRWRGTTIVRQKPKTARLWGAEAAQFAVLGLVTVALAEIGTILLAVLSTPDQAGLFRIASRAFLLAGFVTLAAQQAYGPRIARDWQTGRWQALEHPSRMISIAALTGSLGSFLIFAIAGRWVIEVTFGAAFRAAYVPSLIMIAGACSISIGAVSPRLLKMTGEQRVVLHGSLLALAAAVILNLALIPPLGATGCAIASAVAATLGRLVMNQGVRRHLGFSPLPNRSSAVAVWGHLRRAMPRTG